MEAIIDQHFSNLEVKRKVLDPGIQCLKIILKLDRCRRLGTLWASRENDCLRCTMSPQSRYSGWKMDPDVQKVIQEKK